MSLIWFFTPVAGMNKQSRSSDKDRRTSQQWQETNTGSDSRRKYARSMQGTNACRLLPAATATFLVVVAAAFANFAAFEPGTMFTVLHIVQRTVKSGRELGFAAPHVGQASLSSVIPALQPGHVQLNVVGGIMTSFLHCLQLIFVGRSARCSTPSLVLLNAPTAAFLANPKTVPTVSMTSTRGPSFRRTKAHHFGVSGFYGLDWTNPLTFKTWSP